jgi:uncharacterized protein YgfB (UPF0149 family)
MHSPSSFSELAATLREIGSAADAAQFHGALCGTLCRQRPEEVDVVDLLDDDEITPQASRAALQALCIDTATLLAHADGRFAPILPDDDAELQLRAQALGGWCEGFLYGLAGRIKLQLDECSDEVRELVKDLAQFTRAGFDSGDDPEVEENAYFELVEYLRVGVQLIYLELRPRALGAEAPRPTVH